MPVRLALARARPEIVAMNDKRLFLFVADLVNGRDAALLSERRIGQHHFVFNVFTDERGFEFLVVFKWLETNGLKLTAHFPKTYFYRHISPTFPLRGLPPSQNRDEAANIVELLC